MIARQSIPKTKQSPAVTPDSVCCDGDDDDDDDSDYVDESSISSER